LWGVEKLMSAQWRGTLFSAPCLTKLPLPDSPSDTPRRGRSREPLSRRHRHSEKPSKSEPA
jgi:hypothetical protein